MGDRPLPPPSTSFGHCTIHGRAFYLIVSFQRLTRTSNTRTRCGGASASFFKLQQTVSRKQEDSARTRGDIVFASRLQEMASNTADMTPALSSPQKGTTNTNEPR